MRKILTTLAVIFCFTIITKAQYVNISDWDFGNSISQQYPSCIVWDNVNFIWHLDTSCSGVTTGKRLFVSNAANINEIRFFRSLQFLSLNNCQNLQSFPILPASIDTIVSEVPYPNKSTLSSFTSYPHKLKVLDLSRCSFKSLPILTTDSLKTLRIFSNDTFNLTVLPTGLQGFDLSYTLIKDLPAIPNTVTAIHIEGSLVNCLPKLPDSLTTLGIDTNKIKCLPNKPKNLLVYHNGMASGYVSVYPVCNSTNNPNNCPTYSTTQNYVNIPDTNFGRFLLAQYPNCLYKDANNKYWMDTTCGAVVNEDSLDCNNQNIQDITGFTFFKNLKYFNCSQNSISILPALPQSLLELNIWINQITNLPILPNSLRNINCASNPISTLPTLPDSLRGLNCSFTHLTSLPALPNSLVYLYCGVNDLGTLPTLPSNLLYLFCQICNLSSLPNLPNNLDLLVCTDNKLSSLPNLPATLKTLQCGGNKDLKCLPVLPTGLNSLDTDTSVHCLPNIPAGITTTLPICNSTNNPNNCPTFNPYVNIPDTNFGKFLIAQYPNCLYKDTNNKYWMDTTCGAVINEMVMSIKNNTNITDIEGIQYFKSLDSLTLIGLNNAAFDTIKNLPTAIRYLTIQHCLNFTTFNSLPNNLVSLICDTNKISNLPVLPNNLQNLSCQFNFLHNTLTNLPAGLLYYNCSDNLVTSLPVLPVSLVSLIVSKNAGLQCLPKLPATLNNLNISNTAVQCLPNIPSGLATTLPVCNSTNNPNNCPITNPYVNIPDTNFGKFLIAQYPACLYKDTSNKYWIDTTCSAVVNEDSLDCSGLYIDSFYGIQFFKNLIYLNANSSQYHTLDNLPTNLKTLICGGNTMYPRAIGQLPNSLTTLDFSGGFEITLTNLPNSLINLIGRNSTINNLPNFPTTLKKLDLHSHLSGDYAYHNLPVLPNGLIYLDISWGLGFGFGFTNTLSHLPDSLEIMNLWGADSYITCLPKIPYGIDSLFIDTASIKCLPNNFGGVIIDNSNFIAPQIVCNSSYNPNNCPTFGSGLPNYVNIPDTNFAKFLIAQYPSCLYKDTSNKYWMDTTCGAVVNDTSWIDCSNETITSIKGIQYFKKLKQLNCQNNKITNLDNLPNSITYIDCSINQITSIQNLPDSLKFINCLDNKISLLPTLPQNLNTLWCPGNQLVNLPILPNSLLSLDCSSNHISNLPILPSNLISLECGFNQISNLPSLPSPLKNLYCSNNNISSLPILPNNLKNLFCHKNPLSNLPVLPNKLSLLSIYGCKNLQCLPSLSDSLTKLIFDSATIKCIPNRPNQLSFYDSAATISYATYPICNSTNNPNNCLVFNPYVNIPDSNFGRFLLAQYPSCLYKDTNNKYWMDTTCRAVVNETSINCRNQNINSINGINYFKNLNEFNCTNNNISDIITLPNSLEQFRCDSNKITNLPSLPKNLKLLYCSHNNLGNLPSINDSLYYVVCNHNHLNFLPKLSTYLFILDCSYNPITMIPSLDSVGINNDILGTGLWGVFNFKHTGITCLPKLPNFNKQGFAIYVDSIVTCKPNQSWSHQVMYNDVQELTTICNPTNNPNQCFIYPSVSSKVFTDNNSNGTKDTLEFYRPFVKLSLNNGQYTYSNLKGEFGISLDTFGSYTLTATPPPYYKAVPDSVNITFTQGSPSIILPDIALQPIAVKDSFAIKITKLNRPRPGFKYAYNVSYGNVGTVSSTTDNIIPINYDTSKLYFDSASVAVTINGSSNAPIEVNAGKLVAGQGGSFNLYFTVKPTVSIGDSIKTAATIIYNTTKIFDVDSAVVVGSFDPNDKQATPTLTPVQIQNGDYIDYVVRFQNTGNANATNIVIADTLSSLLLYNNIQVVASSHNSNISYRLGNGIIYFEFLNIDLPYASANEPLSHGFVRFRVKALPTLATGAIIPNTASIYFDYNTPIITNTATTLIKAIVTPVRIINYNVTLNEKQETKNAWTVGVEVNVSHYVVQRSENGRDFKSIGEVIAQGLNNYSFTDKLPIDLRQTVIYYRLKMVDKDGKVSYSEVKKLSTINYQLSTINIYPNPAKDVVNIGVEGGKELLIIDYLGKKVLSKSIINHQQLTINNLPKGVYMVKVIMNNGDVKTSKLIIE